MSDDRGRTLSYKQQCTTCRQDILTSTDRLPVNVALQGLIERRYPRQLAERKAAIQEYEERERLSKTKADNIPILRGVSLHLLPGMKSILTVSGRQAMDLIHHVTQGNRRFLLLKNPSDDMRGFIVELKRLIPTQVRGETMLEVSGAERYIADQVYIPEERRGLYLNEADALWFANGRIVKDNEDIG